MLDTPSNTNSSRFCEIIALGYGSSGLILAAFDKKLQKRVVLKRLTFSDVQSCKQGLREIKIIRRLEHSNIIKVFEIVGPNGNPLDVNITPSSLTQLGCVYLVEELLDTDLAQLIAQKQLTEGHRKWFLYQLLLGLRYLHSANVLHRDLTPRNLLVNCNDLILKIADFGLSRVLDPNYGHKGYLTERVGHCWYRSPEQIMYGREYGQPIDIWSAGCVFAEMLLGKPLFPGVNELDQIRQILDAIHLDEDDWNEVLQVVPNKLLKNHPFRPRHPLGARLGNIDPKGLDLLEKMLCFSPNKRIDACKALKHPYLSEFNELDCESIAARPLHIEHEVDEQLSPGTMCSSLVEESCSQPVSCSSVWVNTSRHDQEHTLEQILSINKDDQALQHKSESVEDLNKKNLKNSQENLSQVSSRPSSDSIEQYEAQSPTNQRVSEDEKDIAEISSDKEKEDQELNHDTKQTGTKLVVDMGSKIIEQQTPVMEGVKTNIEQSTDRDDTEWKVLEYEQWLEYSKCEVDNTQNEKDTRRNSFSRLNRPSAQNAASDLDERYRLPTEHLRNDRDYSNERIKHKKLAAQYRQLQSLYREELNHINERLKEANLDGAVGGEALDEDPTLLLDFLESASGRDSQLYGSGMVHLNIHPPDAPLLIRTDLQAIPHAQIYNSSRLSAERQLCHIYEGYSSPEDRPASPRTGTGAKPKKGSRNNRR